MKKVHNKKTIKNIAGLLLLTSLTSACSDATDNQDTTQNNTDTTEVTVVSNDTEQSENTNSADSTKKENENLANADTVTAETATASTQNKKFQDDQKQSEQSSKPSSDTSNSKPTDSKVVKEVKQTDSSKKEKEAKSEKKSENQANNKTENASVAPAAESVTNTDNVQEAVVIIETQEATEIISDAETKAAANKLNVLLKNLTTMQANFTQKTETPDAKPQKTTTLSSSGLNKSFTGSMQVQRPNKFYWKTNKPTEQIIIANQKTLLIYDPDLMQATQQTVNAQFANTPAMLLSGDVKAIEKNYTVTLADDNTFVLFPKSAEAVFNKLTISFDNKLPQSMVLNDALDQQTTINFTNVVLNKKIAKDVFEFVVPVGVDVIQQ